MKEEPASLLDEADYPLKFYEAVEAAENRGEPIETNPLFRGDPLEKPAEEPCKE